jgi:hypothetical protein
MKGESDIVSGLQAMKRAFDHWDSFIRERPGSLAERMFGGYCKRLAWIANDLITCPHFPQVVRDGIRKEWTADPFMTMAIAEKAALLPPDQRDIIETVIDRLITGERLQIELKPEAHEPEAVDADAQ